MEKMVVRQPVLNQDNLHPEAKKRYNAMMQEPEPLAFQLHAWPVPEVQAKIDAIKAVRDARVQAGEAGPNAMFAAASSIFIPLNKPLGTLEQLPF
mmetsp:Transcript_649/g.878  ORF Transcript_649/g.878 Transcript_649/m.878 type:complete len:95 (+) Transcript_649:92-376(+)